MYVSDWGKHSVSVFSSKGNFVASFGHKGMEAGQFSCPSGLAVDEDNAILFKHCCRPAPSCSYDT